MSELRANTISDTAGTGPVTLTKQIAHKVMLHYDQTVPNIVQSLNVSSVSDDSTGNYTVTFTNAFTNADYYSGNSSSGNAMGTANPVTASTMTGRTQVASTGGLLDMSNSYPTAAGDLA